MSIKIGKPIAVFCGELKSEVLSSTLKKSFEVKSFKTNNELYNCKNLQSDRVELLILSVDGSLKEEFLVQFVNLRLVFSLTTSLTHIDEKALTNLKLNNKLLSLRDFWEKMSVVTGASDLALTLLVVALRKIFFISNFSIQDGNFSRRPDMLTNDFSSTHIGIIGYGRIGKQVGIYLKGLGIKFSIYDPFAEKIEGNISFNNLGDMISSVDGVLISSGWKPNAKPIITDEMLQYISNPNFFIVNISRGELVCESSIIRSLEYRQLDSYLTDVYTESLSGKIFSSSKDPVLCDLIDSGRLVILPHVGGFTKGSTIKTQEILADYISKEY